MDFALDTNDKKDVARKMIQMTMALNADYLKDVGEATKKEKVTCYTCHHGEETPALAPAAGWARGNFTLIPTWSLLGAAVTSSVAYSVKAAALTGLFLATSGISLPQLVGLKEYSPDPA